MAFFDNPHYDFKGMQFMSVNVPMFLTKPIVKKALREDSESEDLVKLIKKIGDVKLLMVSNGNKEMLADFTKYLRKNNYEEWMTIKKENEIINFQAKQKNDEIRKLLITVKSENELIFVDVSGKFTADDLSQLISYSEKKDIKKLVSN